MKMPAPLLHIAAIASIAACCAASAAHPSVTTAAVVAEGARQPRVATSPDGNHAYVVYGKGEDVYLRTIETSTATASSTATSTTATTATAAVTTSTFSAPSLVAHVSGLMLGMRRGPQIACTISTVVVTACGAEGNVDCWTSDLSAKTWNRPVIVNDRHGSANEGLTGLTSGHNGFLYSVWLDTRNGGHQLFGSGSNDGGRTWTANACVYSSPEGTVCECCQPQVAVRNSDGLVCVMWRNWLHGARDMYQAESSDGGVHFSPAVKLGQQSWMLRGCPMDGGTLSACGAETSVTAVWRWEKSLYLTRGAGNEQLLGEGRNASSAYVAATNTCYVCWQDPNDQILLKPGDNAPAIVVGTGKFPSIAATPNGAAIIVWESNNNAVSARFTP